MATSEKGLPNLENFNVHESAAGSKWKKYLLRFKNMMDAFEITDDKRKKALLLHYAGEDTFNIYTTFTGYDNLNFTQLCEKLNGYFNPKKCVEYEVHKFRKLSQKEDESLDDFHTRLQLRADDCEFQNKELEIKMQVIQKCKSNKLRKSAQQKTMYLQEILSLGRSLEIAASQAEEIAEKSEKILKLQNKDSKFKKPKKEKFCYRCGGPWPHKDKCPAFGKQCKKCDGLNHFSKVCKTKKFKVNNLQEDTSSSSNSDEEFI